MKTCKRCGIEKSFSEFRKTKDTKTVTRLGVMSATRKETPNGQKRIGKG